MIIGNETRSSSLTIYHPIYQTPSRRIIVEDAVVSWNQDDDTLVVQRFSAEVSGKDQKYSRIGAREFVPHEYEGLTIESIQKACQKYFTVDEMMTCDVVAGEKGPSSSSMKLIPDTKVM